MKIQAGDCESSQTGSVILDAKALSWREFIWSRDTELEQCRWHSVRLENLRQVHHTGWEARGSASFIIACILQRAQEINSAGGYLRALTEKAKVEEFFVGPMLMAALKTNGVTARATG